MMAQSLRLQVPWAEAARRAGRENVQITRFGVLQRTTHLMRAARGGDVVRVRQLVQLGAPLDLVDREGLSALHRACYEGHVAVAKVLLDGKFEGCGAAIDLQDERGWTPLMWASSWGQESVVRLLLARGANMAQHSGSGKLALGLAK